MVNFAQICDSDIEMTQLFGENWHKYMGPTSKTPEQKPYPNQSELPHPLGIVLPVPQI